MRSTEIVKQSAILCTAFIQRHSKADVTFFANQNSVVTPHAQRLRVRDHLIGQNVTSAYAHAHVYTAPMHVHVYRIGQMAEQIASKLGTVTLHDKVVTSSPTESCHVNRVWHGPAWLKAFDDQYHI